jgi:hypothetical protein
MPDDGNSRNGPDLLLEAARVLNAAGVADYEVAAAALIAEAVKLRDQADAKVRQAITADAAALYLSGRLPGGYMKALELLKPVGGDKADDEDGRMHLLRALARGQQYKAVKAGADTAPADELRRDIRHDLKLAFDRIPNLKQENRWFWQPPTRAESAAAAAGSEADLAEVYNDDPQFQELVR